MINNVYIIIDNLKQLYNYAEKNIEHMGSFLHDCLTWLTDTCCHSLVPRPKVTQLQVDYITATRK